jgi:hypothetical protein
LMPDLMPAVMRDSWMGATSTVATSLREAP